MAANLFLVICVTLVVLSQRVACVKAQLYDYVPVKAPVESKDDPAKMIAKILKAERMINRLKKNELLYKEAEKYEKVADDMVRHAATEQDELTKFKQLQMANEIMNNPIGSMTSLKAKLAARAAAQEALDKAKAEKDPQKQKLLLKEAEDLVLEFKTGKKPISEVKAKLELKAPFVSMDQVEGLFGQDLDRYADKIAKQLINLAKSTTDAAFRNNTLELATGIIAHPRTNLREYARTQAIRSSMAKVADGMTAKLLTEKDTSFRRLLASRIALLKHDPVGFYDRLVEDEQNKVVMLAMKKAKELGELAEKEKDLAKSEFLMKEAMLFEENPLNAWANLTENKLKNDIIKGSPTICRPFVQDAYSLSKDPVDKTFTEITTPPKPLPVSGIVNFAYVNSENTKKEKAVDNDFDVEKHYIKLSFTGWLHRNSELGNEKSNIVSHSKSKANPAEK